MSFTFKLRSHTKKDQPFERGQLLIDHLYGVRDIALKTNKDHGIGNELDDVISTICLSHDFGKASSYFQNYLQHKYNGVLKRHGEISAYFTYYMLPEHWKLIGFMCVKKHHGNLYPEKKFFHSENEKNLVEICDDIKTSVKELNEIYGKDISGFFELMKDSKYINRISKEYRNKFDKFSIEELVYTQYLWSLLLTADKNQLIRKGCQYENKTIIDNSFISKYKKKLIKGLKEKSPLLEKTDLFKIRNDVYDEVLNSITKADINKNKVFSINLPTGTGKTLCVYGAAFKLFERLISESKTCIKPSIIYCLPFTSIIDQNFLVLEDIFDTNGIKKYEDFILKYHSLTPLEYKYMLKDEELEFRNYDARFCVENWQSTVISTTFVQLFNTIFKVGDNSIGNRYHRLAGSIIILDEVQAIPPKYYNIIEDVFKILCEKFNTYVITVTATKPLFLKGVELVKDNRKIFKRMNRISIENHTIKDISLDEFACILKEDIKSNPNKSFLIVLNTVKSACTLAKELEKTKRNVIYLSTELFPQYRLDIIDKIKDNKSKKYVLVSTQLIEAGVDVDFDMVYRDFSTMDSINQTAGRANRNAINGKGVVKIFSLIDLDNKSKKYSSYIYPHSLIEATKRILENRDILEEKEIYEINQKYFEIVNNIKSCDSYSDINSAIKEIDFREIGRLFQLIDNDYEKEDIIININEETQKNLNIIGEQKSEYQEVLNAWRILNKYKISVYKKNNNDIPCESFKGMNVLDSSYYNERWGITRTNSVML